MSDWKWVVRNPPHSLPELWLGDEVCVSDRLFNSERASEIARKLNAHDDLLAACKAAEALIQIASPNGLTHDMIRAAIQKSEGDA